MLSGGKYPAGTDFKGRERLKNISTTFEKHYICSAMSTSSRSVIYTGRHITYTKMFDNTDMSYMYSMSPKLTTVGDIMRSGGYYTAYKGKLHLAGSGVHDDTYNTIFNTTNRLEIYGFSDWNSDGDTPGGVEEGYTTDATIAANATDWLRNQGASLDAQGKPFFLAVNLINPHDIMYFNTDAPGETAQASTKLTNTVIRRTPSNDIYQKSYGEAPIPSSYTEIISDESKVVPAHYEYYKIWGSNVGVVPARVANWQRFRDYYYNCIKDSDMQLERILDELERLGMLKDTVVVMKADHGEMQGAHRLDGKGNNIYENNIHVPLMIYWPGVKSGDCAALTSHVDLAKTFADIAGASDGSLAADMPGRSLLPLIQGKAAEVRSDDLFACSLLSVIDSTASPNKKIPLDSAKRGIVRGIVTSDGWKFARYFTPSGFNTPRTLDELFADNDVEVFDLNTYPDEVNNLAPAMRTASPDRLLALNSRLNAAIEREIGSDDGAEFSRVKAAETSADSSSGGGSGCSSGLPIAALFASPLGLLLLEKHRRK